MKEVYNYFIIYYKSILESNNYSNEVEKGIVDYLKSVDLFECNESDLDYEKIANNELKRFKFMPYDTFVAFFENYAVREQLISLEKECYVLATERFINNRIVSNDVYKEKMKTFYEIAEKIVSDKRYSGWLDELSNTCSLLLKFASGMVDIVPQTIDEYFDSALNEGE